MAIQAVGIYPNEQGKAIGTSKRILPGQSAPSMQIRFRTQSNTATSWNIWVTARGINTAGNAQINSYTSLGTAGRTGITGLSPTGSVAAGFVYSVPFSSVTGLNDLVKTLTYSGRSYDAIELTIEVRAFWDGGNSYLAQTCYIGFIPAYDPDGAVWGGNGLAISYEATDPWGRPNDRWQLETDLKDKQERVVFKKGVWGTVDGYGSIVLPKSKSLRVPNTGDELFGTFRMVGSWMVEGSVLNTLTLNGGAGATVDNSYDLETPVLTANIEQGGVRVTVGQTSTGKTALETVGVQLVGSDWAPDRAEVAVGGSFLFEAVPRGVQTVWSGIGYATVDGEKVASDAAETTCGPYQSSGCAIVPVGGGAVRIPYNIVSSSQSKPESESVKLAGRDRETVGYGEGGSVTWSISGKVVADGFGAMYGGAAMETTDLDALRNLPMAGVCIVCLPEGERAQVELTNVSISRQQAGELRRTVSISAKEVS